MFVKLFLAIVLGMAVSFISESSTVTGSSSLSVDYPSGSVTGDIFILCIAGRANAATQPSASGFTGAGDNFIRAGSGEAVSCILIREATGSESGSVTVAATDWTSTRARMLLFRNATGVWESSECVNGSDTISNGAYALTLNNFDPPDMRTGDYFIACTGVDQEQGGNLSTNHLLSASGLTFGGSPSIRDNIDNSEGDGSSKVLVLHLAVSGSSTNAPDYSIDFDSSVNGTAATVVLRVREGEGEEEPAKDWLHYFRQYSGGAA